MLFTGSSFAASVPGFFSNELNTDHYDCAITLIPDKTVTTKSEVRVLLEWAENAPYVEVLISRKSIKIYAHNGTERKSYGSFTPTMTTGDPYQFTIVRRGISLGILANDAMLFRKDVPRGGGNEAGITIERGWKLDDHSIQRLDPVIFSDDFMRADNDPGSWRVISGRWMLQSAWDNTPNGTTQMFVNTIFAQNPFAWVGSAPPNVPSAVCTAGEPFWEDYTFSVNVRPAADGAVGIAVNMADEQNGIFIRWSPVNDRSARGNRMMMYRVANGKAVSQLAESTGGYLPGQWYKLSVISALDGIRVFVDGIERLQKSGVTPWRGAVGLYVEGQNGAIFDDISVNGQSLNSDLLYELQQTQTNQRFEDDVNGMKNWSDVRTDWLPTAGVPGHYWFRREVYGEHLWMVVNFRPRPTDGGEFTMQLNGDGTSATSGYRMSVQVPSAGEKPVYTLYRGTEVLQSATGNAPLDPQSEYSFRFWRSGNRIWLEVDDELVIEATNVASLTGLRAAYRATGCFLSANEVHVLSRNLLDYTFASAHSDWLTDGTWMPTIRWSCEPKWSFLGGWSRGEAVMWHKQRFTGDHSLGAFIGVKMEMPRESEAYGARYRDLAVTICGDGQNEKSGYSGIFAYPSADSKRHIVIMRNGTIVADKELPPDLTPNQGANHRTWFELTIAKRSNVIDFDVRWLVQQGNDRASIKQIAISYTDPNPLDEGIPAIWSVNNAISIARTRLNFAQQPQPRTDPQITIADPYLPEYANVNTPLTLDFSDSWATSGKRLEMQATLRNAPPGNEQALKVDGARVIFTPKVATRPNSNGSRDAREHWYQITATDGQTVSPRYPLVLQVFDPAIGRDDSHALLLYRFNEGKDALVADQSKTTPKVNLKIEPLKDSTQLSAHWLPGHGLAVNRDSRVISDAVADKLMAINTTRAMSVEFWISSDTLYPKADVMNWNSALISWDNLNVIDGSKRNFTFGQSTGNFLLSPFNRTPFQSGKMQRCGGMRIGLQHVMACWDGTQTHIYVDGIKMQTQNIPWLTEQWVAGSHLFLGNDAKGTNPQVGAYYLLAIHDRAFTEQEVKRHYQAGPSSR